MSATPTSAKFTTLPDQETLESTVVALEEHGFSVEVVDDLDAAREAVLARIPEGSSVMTNTSVTLTGDGHRRGDQRQWQVRLDPQQDDGARFRDPGTGDEGDRRPALFRARERPCRDRGGSCRDCLGLRQSTRRFGRGVPPTSSLPSARRSSSRHSRQRASGASSTAPNSRSLVPLPPTGRTAPAGRSSRSTRNCPAASTSSSSAVRSATEPPSRPDTPRHQEMAP